MAEIDWTKIPDKKEMYRRFREKITIRQAELWIAAELRNAAGIIEENDTKSTTRMDAIMAVDALYSVLTFITSCIRE